MALSNTQQILLGAYNAAPPYIKTFIGSGKFEQFMSALQARTNLHMDIADKVSNEILMTMLGMAEPQELPDNLRSEAKVPEELINPIIEEVNRSIFVPLQAELRNNPDALKQAPKTAEPPKPQWVQVGAPQKPLTPSQPLAQTPIYTPPPPAPSISAFNQPQAVSNPFVPQAPPDLVLPGAAAATLPTQPALPPQPNFQAQPIEHQQAPASQPPPVQYIPAAAQPMQPPEVQAPQPVAPRPPVPAPQTFPQAEAVAMVRTMGTDMEAMRRGEQPSAHAMNIPVTLPSAQPMQSARPVPPPQPIQPPQPPQWIPPAAQQATATSPQWSTAGPLSEPAPRPSAPSQQYTRPYIPPTPRVAPRSAPTPASGDPYREPVE